MTDRTDAGDAGNDERANHARRLAERLDELTPRKRAIVMEMIAQLERGEEIDVVTAVAEGHRRSA